MSFKVRSGERKDAAAIFNLIIELAVFEKEPNAVKITVDDIIRDGFSTKPKFKTYVAEELDGTIIGMALFYERYSTWKGKTLHLEDLMVTEARRGIGAGKKLYASIMNHAKENDFKRVAWEVLDWNVNAIDFYKSTGATVYDQWRVCHMNEQNVIQFCNENI